MKVLEKTTKFVNRHFQVGLSWKNDFPILQRNCEHAIQRFKYLKTWFLKNPEFFNMCRTQIGDYIISGQAKLLSLEKKHKTNSITNYILHHEVQSCTMESCTMAVSSLMLQPRSAKHI